MPAEIVAHALLRAATALVPSHGIRKIRSHECERSAHECVRHSDWSMGQQVGQQMGQVGQQMGQQVGQAAGNI